MTGTRLNIDNIASLQGAMKYSLTNIPSPSPPDIQYFLVTGGNKSGRAETVTILSIYQGSTEMEKTSLEPFSDTKNINAVFFSSSQNLKNLPLKIQKLGFSFCIGQHTFRQSGEKTILC